jgi:hypothetical protein
MGRTISKFGDDEDDRRKKSTKSLKHSKNIPGQGMRVINNWSEEDYNTYDNSDLDYEYNKYTSQTQRKHKGNTNGY